jgi:hypothetical protein
MRKTFQATFFGGYIALVGVGGAQEGAPPNPAAEPAVVESPAATPPPAPQAPHSEFSVPVESLKLGGAKAGFMETGSAAGGRQILVRTGQGRMQVLGKTRTRLTNHFRYMKGETEVTLAGSCTIRMEGRSMFNIDFSQNKARAYRCEFTDQAEDQYAMEVALPAFAELNVGGGMFGVQISRDRPDAEVQAILKAKLIFAGAAYEATPTGFGKDQLLSRRVVQGYTITRDGKPVGRVTFRNTSRDQGEIVIPVADADGREAVLFMIMSLNAMPDVYAALVREELKW